MLLKTVKEAGRIILSLGTSVLFGVIGGFAFLAKDRFECATSHIDPGVTFDFGKLNYTELMQMFLNHNGTIQLPIEIHPTVDLGSCETPLIVGALVGAGAGTLWLSALYAQQCQKQRANRMLLSNEQYQYGPERRALLEV